MGGEKPLIMSTSSLPGDYFSDNALEIEVRLGNSNEITFISLLDTGATGVAFINQSIVQSMSKKLQIPILKLAKPSHIYTSNNTLNLVMIGAAPFNMLAKEKKAKIYAISMLDIDYQLNK